MLMFLPLPACGERSDRMKCDPGEGDSPRVPMPPYPSPQPSPRKERGEGVHRYCGDSYGSKRSSFACLNHFLNIASVSIISVNPAWLIFTVETMDGGPDSVWPYRIW